MIVAVKVIPRSRQAGCAWRENTLIIKVTKPASEGQATEAARRALAKILSLPVNSVILVSGVKSRNKLFSLPDDVGWPPQL
ncbi:MAG: DUF167 domain-containing protein [Candidatus Komeilibacteria bacterium]